MSFANFNPIVRQWFATEVGEPTSAQLRGWESIAAGRHTLIAAPTGSGKTLAAFLTAINELIEESRTGPLPDEVRIVYVSPLKALSADIHKNLALPRAGIERLAAAAGLPPPRVTAAVRTGDTPQAERTAMLRIPPHILVTTPESLYLLLTSDRSRQMLRTVRTVIVDEIHAVIGSRRGAHLALTLERLAAVATAPLQRIGLSATQTPIEEVARFLTAGAADGCAIVDAGHRRQMDLDIEMPRSALDAVMSHEVWDEYYDRLTELIASHRTTLIFVNTRKLAERVTRHLSERLGEDAVTAHHGSLSKERRLDAETRLKAGHLKALVATASLELGIDIGHVDLVCQIGSPHRIATLLQRVGRSGHTITGMPKGRVFPESRDDLVECAALLRAVRAGVLDAIVCHEAPLDVLAQQLVAETTCQEYREDVLYGLVTRAWPYRGLDRASFDAVLRMVADGFATRRGRRAALVHRDEVNATVRARRGARLLAQTSGGAIPEIADYRVVLDPDDTFIGTLNEDFAIESTAGDIFQLGNASWRILQVAGGNVRVADAKGAPPTIPFWLGEAPARSDELSHAVSELRAEIDHRLDDPAALPGTLAWLMEETGIHREAAAQILAYLAEGRRALGAIPSQQTLILERFFDEAGGMQLVLHAPFGSRINKAWGLALRKRFCRQFNFELQAAATEDALMLSLGPQHSFPLSDVFRYLHPETTRDVLVQAFLDAPVFKTRWRWNTTISLAVPRARGGRRVAPPIQRMMADDLMAAVFPDAAACLENIPGDRQIPDHPLVSQTVRDCLEEAMDFEGLRALLGRIHRGELRLVARDTPEPSLFASEILNARPYAFLDDAPLEERRSHAVQTRRSTDPSSAGDLGALDADAIARVREEERPDPRDAHELHDALVTAGFLCEDELDGMSPDLLASLTTARRAGIVTCALASGLPRRIAAAVERLPELRAIHPELIVSEVLQPPASRSTRSWTRDEAIAEIVRGRLSLVGPVTVATMADLLAVTATDVDAAFLQLEADGVVLRGRFTPGERELEWCDRSLLARIHRYTLNRLRAEIEPVSPADFMRFLFRWQHVETSSRLSGLDGLREVVASLDGYELAAGAWERAVLPARLDRYDPSMLDMLCLSGEAAWSRLSPARPGGSAPAALVPSTPIALFLREHAEVWRTLRVVTECETPLSDAATRVLAVLRARGASFFNDLAAASSLDADQLRHAIGTLVASGLVTSDEFSGLRALLWAARGRPPRHDRRSTFAGRWTAEATAGDATLREQAVETQAWALLCRYGVVFRRMLVRETTAVTWRELARVYRRLEARGEIRSGRFVTGMSGEQFALPEAVERLREVRRMSPDGVLLTISAADPLNLAGIVTAGERVRATTRSRIVYRDGVPLAVVDADVVRELAPIDPAIAADVWRALRARRVPTTLAIQ
ncbi:MAG TPA: DEAD/DEAH box helicase [Vicinamibacterales bacterium]|nr:DEAD/DEAH box helicase [Vicinamibacterales bacterium]